VGFFVIKTCFIVSLYLIDFVCVEVIYWKEILIFLEELLQ